MRLRANWAIVSRQRAIGRNDAASGAAGPDGKGITQEIDEYDSGVFVRGQGRTQVNLWNWSIGSGEVYGIRNDAKQPLPIRAALTPRVPADKPMGEWNRFVITV